MEAKGERGGGMEDDGCGGVPSAERDGSKFGKDGVE